MSAPILLTDGIKAPTSLEDMAGDPAERYGPLGVAIAAHSIELAVKEGNPDSTRRGMLLVAATLMAVMPKQV